MSHRQIVRDPTELRALIGNSAVGLVPTMGALHAGHTSLIRQSSSENQCTVVSIFVNPTQFENAADLAVYPRNLEADANQAFAAGANIIFAPTADTIYPPEFSTSISVTGLTELWEGAARPGHFTAVATVVAILLNMVRPLRSYFGEKDFQQLAMIRRLQSDLSLPGEIVGCPTIRDADGLALSSRNARLSVAERSSARAIPEVLFSIRDRVNDGDRASAKLIETGRSILARQRLLTIDYLAIVNSTTLLPAPVVGIDVRALVAVHAGATRLIDNIDLSGDAKLS